MSEDKALKITMQMKKKAVMKANRNARNKKFRSLSVANANTRGKKSKGKSFDSLAQSRECRSTECRTTTKTN